MLIGINIARVARLIRCRARHRKRGFAQRGAGECQDTSGAGRDSGTLRLRQRLSFLSAKLGPPRASPRVVGLGRRLVCILHRAGRVRQALRIARRSPDPGAGVHLCRWADGAGGAVDELPRAWLQFDCQPLGGLLSSRFAYFALRCVAQTSLRRSDDFWVGNHFDVPDVVARRLFDSELVHDVLPTWSSWRFEAVVPPRSGLAAFGVNCRFNRLSYLCEYAYSWIGRQCPYENTPCSK